METFNRKKEKITQSITFKAIIIGIIILLMLIPKVMIESLIYERKNRSTQTIEKINDKWSKAQTINGPILSIPYLTRTVGPENNIQIKEQIINIAPGNLKIDVNIDPEERYYGIYKAILYKSEINFSGDFPQIDFSDILYDSILWEKSYISFYISDLRGVTKNIDLKLNGVQYAGNINNSNIEVTDKKMIVKLNNKEIFFDDQKLNFTGKLFLNGSGSINFIPVGKTTTVDINGEWSNPSFIGSFSPEHKIDKNKFTASWSILHFNRSIPEMWQNNNIPYFENSSFGVSLIETVDHYQKNMRSAKYALMFITLTFVVFFFVEIISKKRIHPIQYLLVGIALILFYSLLLSLSEQINFSIAYLIASAATILLISIYSYSIFKNKSQTIILFSLLCFLYIFLFITLQLEDVALLIGSIGLFIILGIIMYFSKRINWYKQDSEELNP